MTPHAHTRARMADNARVIILPMIHLHYWPTPNGHKIVMFLEEASVPYQVHPVNIGAGEQFNAEFLAISPNNRIPVILDDAPVDGGPPVPVFESAAILIYLAEKTGRFLPPELRGRNTAIEWLIWQAANLGPVAGQNHHFVTYAEEKISYAMQRFIDETNRLYGVLDIRLRDRAFIAGDQYTIADMACYPWIVPWKRQQQKLDDFPSLRRWFDTIRARPATVRTYELAGTFKSGPMTEEARKILFGQTAARIRSN